MFASQIPSSRHWGAERQLTNLPIDVDIRDLDIYWMTMTFSWKLQNRSNLVMLDLLRK
jgi:hypothetical protein